MRRSYDRPVPAPRSSARRLLRWSGRLAAGVVTLAAALGVLRLVLPVTAEATGVPIGVERQLAFLRVALDDGAGERAQRQFPEGYFFLHVL